MSIANATFEASGIASLDDKQLHVYRSWRRPGWAVRRTGCARAMRVFNTKTEAIRYAERYEIPVYVHGPDGLVQRVVVPTRPSKSKTVQLSARRSAKDPAEETS